jgi:hypothetical protein
MEPRSGAYCAHARQVGYVLLGSLVGLRSLQMPYCTRNKFHAMYRARVLTISRESGVPASPLTTGRRGDLPCCSPMLCCTPVVMSICYLYYSHAS